MVRGPFSPARAWRPAVAARLARTLGLAKNALGCTLLNPKTVNVVAILLLLLLVGLATAYLLRRTDKPPKVRHPTIRSKSTVRSFQETNSAARLLAGVTKLKNHNAIWPSILQTLNSDDDPQVRTVLLELRSLHVSEPRVVLDVIEQICVASHRESNTLSRVDILDRAKSQLL